VHDLPSAVSEAATSQAMNEPPIRTTSCAFSAAAADRVGVAERPQVVDLLEMTTRRHSGAGRSLQFAISDLSNSILLLARQRDCARLHVERGHASCV